MQYPHIRNYILKNIPFSFVDSLHKKLNIPNFYETLILFPFKSKLNVVLSGRSLITGNIIDCYYVVVPYFFGLFGLKITKLLGII